MAKAANYTQVAQTIIRHNEHRKTDHRTPESISFSKKITETDVPYFTVEAVTSDLVKISYRNGRPYTKKMKRCTNKLFQAPPINADTFIATDFDWWRANKDMIIGK